MPRIKPALLFAIYRGFLEILNEADLKVNRDQQLEILKGVQSLVSESRQLFSAQKSQLGELGEKLQKTLNGLDMKPSSSQVDQVVAELSKTTSVASEVSTEHQILRSIYFPSIKTRHATIPHAYQETFEWIFKPTSRTSVEKCSEIRLLDWLKSQTGIYWISGSPGSGKSTLMKFLSDHTTTEEALREWAKDKQLISARFFFWNAGNSLQKSYEGLLRSLLYEILRSCPDLIRSACASRWQMVERNQISHGWDSLELSRTFKTLVQQESMSSKFCFFIDGIDEYEGDHYEIVQIFDALSKSSHVKICLSSRPWDIFEDAYGQIMDRKLYLQDLTRGDIDLYVRNNLESHKALADLAPEDKAQYQTVIEEIIKKSKGVFLWVFLVVRSLYDGLTNGDTISRLEDRLRSLPSDLEKYFRLIIDQVDERYQPDMARTFQEALEAGEPLTLLAHSYLDERDPDFAVKLEIGPIDPSKVKSRLSMMRRRINTRCKGLMEVNDLQSVNWYLTTYQVDFLHRTVRDFLLTREMQQILDRYMDNSVNVHRSLCRANVALAKTMPERGSLQIFVENALKQSHKAELATGASDRRLLDELQRTFESRRTFFSKRHEINTFYVHSFFSLVLSEGLHVYVREKLEEKNIVQPYQVHLLLRPGLLSSQEPGNTSAAWVFWLLSIAADYHSEEHFDCRLNTLNELVRGGADPNGRHLDGTIIDALLEWLHSVREDHKTEAETAYLFNVVSILIKNSATPNLCSFRDQTKVLKSPKIPLEETFSQFPPKLAASLLRKSRLRAKPARPPSSRSKRGFRFRLRP